MIQIIMDMLATSGFAYLTLGSIAMVTVALIFLYLGIVKQFEPYLLLPIAFGMLISNLPGAGLMAPPTAYAPAGLFYYFYQGIALVVFPPLIFVSLGVSIDFGPVLANPKTMLLGGAAQIGIFTAFLLAIAFGFTGGEASSIGIIGGADGPTAIFLAGQLAPDLLGAIALAAYSYMALVPIIQPPIVKLLTTKQERAIVMTQTRKVSQREKILFPIIVAMLVILLIPTSAPLVGMLMLGNLLKESGVVPKIVDALRDSLMFIVTVFLGLAIGGSASADTFLTQETLLITALGLVAFMAGTAFGVIAGKIMCKLTGGKVNPMIGAAGVSAVPISARVVHKMGTDENPSNFLLMHAMGPNVAGVVGSAIAAGVLLQIFG